MKISALTIAGILLSTLCNSQTGKTFYTGSTSKTKGSIYQMELNTQNGEIRKIDSLAGLTGPGYLAFSPDRKHLYAVTGDHLLQAFRIEQNKKLTFLNAKDSDGANPCHVTIHPSGKLAFVSNYTGGTFTVYALNRDGTIGEKIYNEKFNGNGPNTQRQEKAHAHGTFLSSDGNYAFVADLGSDRIMNYRVRLNPLSVEPNPLQKSFSLAPGSGPRHLALTTRNNLYILNELTATLTAAIVNKEGEIKLVGTYETVPEQDFKKNTSGAIRLSPDQRFVLVSNRGFNTIHSFRILSGGKLEAADVARENISIPRDFNFDSTGNYIVVGNLNNQSLSVYQFNKKTGKLTYRSDFQGVIEPSCIEFLN